ncbi:hypothetical protein [Tissierella sp. Yu-01]|uniref:hypothetical protein n=1 Tax=Tissierella sp. Yu-01 TaxID=3035694 RepID=UPI00240D908C|nr:hypothetical protein [Tissierella sp. Yu-01]WFA10060.1 hypothetical protein P3962_05760 [Tissierella sp. Yu-01]
MDLKNKIVMHKVFGEGKIVSFSDDYISIEFSVGEKRFLFPDAFKRFIKFKEDDSSEGLISEINDLIAQKQLEKEKKKRKQVLIDQIKAANAEKNNRKKKGKKKGKSSNRANIAFKCNYCDGGQSDEQIGYNGVCSDGVIYNNIEVERRIWCCSEDSDCLKYHNKLITRDELDAQCENDGFVCYESQMLRDWKAFAGIVQSGENKGKPMKLNKIQLNSLCVLTTRDSKSVEEDRYIFAAFLVDETYEGDNREEGYVSTQSKYKIKLSPKEAHKMLFWNYHANNSQSKRAVWSSGLHRYFGDEQAAQILRDIVNLKRGTRDEALAEEFYEHFCHINGINRDAIGPLNGALTKN